MARSTVWFAAVALLGTAPYQCKSNDPERARDETPGEALLRLCGRFAADGNDDAARRTLEYLIERYPSSREAARAKDERNEKHPCASVAAEAEKAKAKPSASK